jgi:glycerol-3-phosphate dehydrogenase
MFDVAIIGAGVVGCAIARSFSIRGWKTLVLEKSSDILEGASKGNSALLHTGFDEPAGSTELGLIREGYDIYRRIHRRMDLPLLERSALVVAWDEQQLGRLGSIAAHALGNGIAGVGLVDRPALLRREPGLAQSALGAVHIPGEAIIDPWSAPLGYMRQALMHGATLLTDAEVIAATREDECWTLASRAATFAARLVVNAGGLFGDRIEALAGRTSEFAVRPRKGQFIVFDKSAHDLIDAIILRVPTERTKGILLTRTAFGNLLLGPTAEDQEDRVHAACDEGTLKRILSEGEAMVPALGEHAITATFAGLRPATQHRDYVLNADRDSKWITVGGIRSTGLTASLGIGEWAARQGAALLGHSLALPSDDDLDWPRMPNLSEASPRPYQRPGRSNIICHCEWVTESEVLDALSGALPAGTLGGLKRRTRVMMGRCQGFSCSGAVRRLAPHLLGLAAK